MVLLRLREAFDNLIKVGEQDNSYIRKGLDMGQMPLIASKDIAHSPGDFNAQIREEGLAVSRQIVEMLANIGVSTAEEFVSVVYAFPLLIAGELGWKISDVWRACGLLTKILPQHMTASITPPEEDSRRHFGARPPSRKV